MPSVACPPRLTEKGERDEGEGRERERELKQSVNQWHGLNIKEYRMTRDIFMTNESWECSRVAKSRNSFREKIAEKRINRKILYF